MARFYYLKVPRVGESYAKTRFLNEEPTNRGEAPRCPKCGNFTGMLPWLPPHRAELELWGCEYGDIAFRGPASELLISERFRERFQDSGLRGLTGFHPVQIVRVLRRTPDAPKSEPPPYYCVLGVQSRAAIDPAASGLEWKEPPTCPECREGQLIRRWKSVMFEPDTWSGEDIFFARGIPGYFTSERFEDFCEQNQISNAILIPAEEYSHDFYPEEKWQKFTKLFRRKR